MALRDRDFLHEDDWRSLQWLVDHGNIIANEDVPHRMLDLRHLLDTAGLQHQLPSYAKVYRDTTLAKGINPIAATNHNAYSITHTLFYVTDWGARPAFTIIPRSHRKRAAGLVEQMLGMALRRNDWDLAAEFLLSWYCLGVTDAPLYNLGWQALVDAQWTNGVMPGPSYNPQRAAEHDEETAASYVFDTCCHTTLVAAFAGGICAPPTSQ